MSLSHGGINKTVKFTVNAPTRRLWQSSPVRFTVSEDGNHNAPRPLPLRHDPTKPNRLLFRILRTVANLPLFGMSARLFLQKALRCGKNLKESPSAEVSISLRSLLISFGSGPPRESSGVAPRAARLVPSSVGDLLILVLFRRQVYVCECRARTQLGGSRGTAVCSSVHSQGRFRRRHSSQHLRGIRPCVQTIK